MIEILILLRVLAQSRQSALSNDDATKILEIVS